MSDGCFVLRRLERLTLLAAFQWGLFVLASSHPSIVVPAMATLTGALAWVGIFGKRRR